MAYIQTHNVHEIRTLVQLGLFDNPVSKTPLVVTVTSMEPETALPVLKPSTHTLTDWQRVLALPIMVLAAAWSAYSREFRNPCINVCGNRTTCERQLSKNIAKVDDEKGCLLHAAYNIGLEWVYGNEEEYSTPLGLANEGGYRVLDI